MILYMVLQKREDGTEEHSIGGGSSTPAKPRVYTSIKRARNYVGGSKDMRIVVIDVDKLETVK